MPNPQEIDRAFTYQAPTEEKKSAHEKIDTTTRAMAHLFDEILPESPEKKLALDALRTARMWANAAIATNP